MESYLKQFLANHQLPDAYLTSAQHHFEPLIESLVSQQQHLQQQERQTITLGINGSQGSGKTTLADYLNTVLSHEHGLKVVSLSIDDFYLSKHDRNQLARTMHPLLATRGVPGTHDVELAIATLEKLKKPGRVAIPRFDKAADDIVAPHQWQTLAAPVDIIIFEGWCLGAAPQNDDDLIAPINELERQQDTDGRWRRYVNQQLQHGYQQLFSQVDSWAMLKAPSFDCVYQWRLEQEHKLAAKLSAQGSTKDDQQLMSDQQIHSFVQYFQRLSQALLENMPVKADFLYRLDQHRTIIEP